MYLAPGTLYSDWMERTLNKNKGKRSGHQLATTANNSALVTLVLPPLYTLDLSNMSYDSRAIQADLSAWMAEATKRVQVEAQLCVISELV